MVSTIKPIGVVPMTPKPFFDKDLEGKAWFILEGFFNCPSYLKRTCGDLKDRLFYGSELREYKAYIRRNVKFQLVDPEFRSTELSPKQKKLQRSTFRKNKEAVNGSIKEANRTARNVQNHLIGIKRKEISHIKAQIKALREGVDTKDLSKRDIKIPDEKEVNIRLRASAPREMAEEAVNKWVDASKSTREAAVEYFDGNKKACVSGEDEDRKEAAHAEMNVAVANAKRDILGLVNENYDFVETNNDDEENEARSLGGD